MQTFQSRRDFLVNASLVTAAGMLGNPSALADEGPPETATLRLSTYPNICLAPGFIADDLLRAEGFTDIRRTPNTPIDAVASGEVDFEFDTAAWVVAHVDTGDPIVGLTGVHSGCYELFAHEPIRTFGDLKGKKLGIDRAGSSAHLLLVTMAARSGSIRMRTSTGSRAPRPGSWTCSPRGGSTLFSDFRPSRRSCARARSVA